MYNILFYTCDRVKYTFGCSRLHDYRKWFLMFCKSSNSNLPFEAQEYICSCINSRIHGYCMVEPISGFC